ncbi:MAG: hypothetical protein II625_08665 [Bacilli bacterium]|nr:hypothetical protein [Bacilli bacterium]
MIEALITIFGICITFIPVVFFVHYLFAHVKKKTRFDYHIELVKDRKGSFGTIMAYLERILLSSLFIVGGIHMSEFFQIEGLTMTFVILLVAYVIVKYFDIKNEK